MKRLILAGIFLVAVTTAAVRYLSADAFRDRLKAGLEHSLGRRVDLNGQVRFNVFPAPGLRALDVTVHDDPRFGLEPAAYITSLEAQIGFLGLLAGRVEISALRLMEPSLNLTHIPGQGWNIAGLSQAGSFPGIAIRGGRVNWKSGLAKAAFYLSDADIDLERRGGQWHLQMASSGGRTDIPAFTLGRFQLRGAISATECDLDFRVVRGALSEWLMLAAGNDPGVHGEVSATAHLKGPLAGIRIEGKTVLEDVHRWDILPAGARALPVAVTGLLDLDTQTVDLATAARQEFELPVAARLRAAGPVATPRWSLHVRAGEIPMAAAVEIARHAGLQAAQGVEAAGSIRGVVGLGPGGAQGGFLIANARFSRGEDQFLAAPKAILTLGGGGATLQSDRAEAGAGEPLSLEIETALPEGLRRFRVASPGLSVASLHAGLRLMPGLSLPPVLASGRGTMSGSLDGQRVDGAFRWNGRFRLKDGEAAVEGLADPVGIRSATVDIDGNSLSVLGLRATAGAIEFTGRYTYDPRQSHAHSLEVESPAATAPELLRLFAPSLRPDRGSLAKTLRLKRWEPPSWLAGRRAKATLRLGRLEAGGATLGQVETQVTWEGVRAEAKPLRFRLAGGSATGSASVEASPTGPRYTFTGRWGGVPWKGGSVELGQVALESSGEGAELVQNLKLSADFGALGISLGPVRAAGGTLEKVPGGELSIQVVEAQTEDGKQTGKGGISNAGRLQIEISNGGARHRFSGTISPFVLEPE
ncbi:MAG: AsmA family protein [Acidobacteria bacterium]|nr:AsmA family protein [Acidobacteriota bacterium]